MDNKTLKSLEFDKVLKVISGYARSEASASEILAIVPFHNREAMETRSGAVSEIRQLISDKTLLGLSRFSDISAALKSVAPEGALLDADEYLAIKEVIAILGILSRQLSERDDLPRLHAIASGLTGFPELKKILDKTFDREGRVVDGASTELSSIRSKIRGLSSRIDRRLTELVREEHVTPFLQDDFITKRGERWVIPVRMDAKGEVAGVVHDVSNSGETAFIEPLEIIGTVNELENLIAEEKGEVIRILKSVCRKIREVAPELGRQFEILVRLDLLNSIALFSTRFSMFAPVFNDESAIRIKEARHPLLLLQQQAGGMVEVIPLDLTLEPGERVMVITGPNAGGKTITIKTAGLLLVMALSGLHVPASPASTFPLASNLLVDIGDDQSIEEALSTFSSHISRIARIISEAEPGSVVLLDEVGTGTEPLQGAAIASAVLKELQARGAVVFATTHLTDIVAFVHKAEGMVNASMAFDPESHRPLYRLTPGEPGQSHALEMAERYGLPKGVIAFAREMLGGQNVELQELMADLKAKAAAHEEARRLLEREEARIEERGVEADENLKAAKTVKRHAREEALQEVKEMIVDARREVRGLINEGKKKPKEALKALEEKGRAVEEELTEFSDAPPLSLDEVKVGDSVFVKSIGFDAKVVEIDAKRSRITVESGALRLESALADLATRSGKKGPSKRGAKKSSVEPSESDSSIKLIGLRVEEALQKLEAFMDGAVVSGLTEARIIHGVGTGALLKAVRSYLEEHPGVESFRRGVQAEGGDGVTVVGLR